MCVRVRAYIGGTYVHAFFHDDDVSATLQVQ